MVAGPRFAIYFVPAQETALYRFGAAVLGYDCYTGAGVSHPRNVRLTEGEWTALTAEPRTYGFHATLKAPFGLRGEFADTDLPAGMQALASSVRNIPTFVPAVELIGGFVAIVPQRPAPALDQMAADCVTAFDRFREPMTAEEKARRTAAGLSQGQAQHLAHWGYPYVFEEFRFHMTLSGRIPPDRRAAIHALLREAFARACGLAPIAVDRLALVRQAHPGVPFRVVETVLLPIGSRGSTA
ncbi:MAG TPA: DUF1045 domain-containing protein [Xanthobacteraceae bacterium]